MGTITLNEKQRRRCEIITRLIANKISNSEASELLGRSSRQVRRMRQRYAAQGLETLVHGNHGRPSPRRRPPAFIEQLRELAGPTGRYHDFNISHLAELLARDEGIKIPPLHTFTPPHYSSHSAATTYQDDGQAHAARAQKCRRHDVANRRFAARLAGRPRSGDGSARRDR